VELAKVTSKGQITIPIQVRKKLGIREGDQVFFVEEQGKMIFLNGSQAGLRRFQDAMRGEATQAGFRTEDDVVRYIKEMRSSKEN
jgi:AbrB family looped-hinge helix DNA binding protein